MLIYDRKSKKDLREVEDGAAEDAPTTLVPFKSVKEEVPSWISEIVEADNKNFMVDSQLFNEDFFDFIKRIFKTIANDHLLSSHKFSWEYHSNFLDLKKVSYEVIGKILLDMLAYYDKNAQLGDIVSSLGSILTFSDSPAALLRGEPSAVATFVNQYFLKDNCAHLLDIMFSCTDATSRRYIGQVASRTMSRLFKCYAECDPESRASCEGIKVIEKTIASFMDNVLVSFKDKQCARSWTRLETFF